MRYYKIIFFSFLILVFAACSSTNKSSQATPGSGTSQAAAPSSRSTGAENNASSAMSTGSSSTKKARNKGYRTHADLVKEAEQRQEANAKRREKEAKLAEKPQYADPSYFGHKKKPKKRSVKKRKHCKECGIVH